MMKQWLFRVAQMIWEVLQNPRNWSLWWRRIWRGCGIALILFLLLSCLSCVLLGVLVGRVSASGADAGLGVILAVDNSNSMFDKGGIGSDPHLRRIEAAQMFINYLGVDSSQGSHRLGVIFFGGEAELVVPLTPLADQARRAEMASLIGDPQRMEWTDPAAALALARDALLAEQDDDRQPVVVLLTDGKPEWDSDPTDAERQAVIEELGRLGRDYADDGIRLFIILLSNEATDADREIETVYVPLWRELTGVTQGRFYPVCQADDLIAVYHDILVVLSGVQTAGAVVEAEIKDETHVEVMTIEPNLARVTFVVRVSRPGASTGLLSDTFPLRQTRGRPSSSLETGGAGSTGASTGLTATSPATSTRGGTRGGSTGITVTIHRPNGQPLRPGDGDVQHAAYGTTDIWAITHPQPGDWTVVMTGQGTVTVWKDYVPAPSTPTPTPMPAPTATLPPTPAPQLVADEWPEVVLAGQPVNLSVAFDPVPPETPSVWAEWMVGEGQPRRERMLDDGRAGDAQAGDGHYGVSLVPTSAGIVLVRVWGEVQGHEIASWEGRLRVERYPSLELVAPEAGDTWRAGGPAMVQARWAIDGESLAAGGWLTATFYSSNDADDVNDEPHMVVTGTVGTPIALDAPQATGTYTLAVQAMGVSPADLPFQGETVTVVAVRRSLPGWVWAGGLGLFVAGLGGWTYYRWFQRLPRLAGRLRVLEAPAVYAGQTLTDLSLLDRRSARVGGAEAELPVPAEGQPWAVVRALPDGSGMEIAPCDGREVRVNEAVVVGSHLLSDGDRIATDGLRLRYEYLHYGL